MVRIFLAITWIKQTFCNFFLYNKIYVRLIILLGWLLFLNRSFTINVETRAQVDDSNDIWYFFFFLKSGYIWARTIVLCMGGGLYVIKKLFLYEKHFKHVLPDNLNLLCTGISPNRKYCTSSIVFGDKLKSKIERKIMTRK